MLVVKKSTNTSMYKQKVKDPIILSSRANCCYILVSCFQIYFFLYTNIPPLFSFKDKWAYSMDTWLFLNLTIDCSFRLTTYYSATRMVSAMKPVGSSLVLSCILLHRTVPCISSSSMYFCSVNENYLMSWEFHLSLIWNKHNHMILL